MSAQHRPQITHHLGHAISTAKKAIEKHTCVSYITTHTSNINPNWFDIKPHHVFTKFMPDGMTALRCQSRKSISNILFNKVPRIRGIMGLSVKYGNNHSVSKYPILWSAKHRTMRPPALEPVTLTAFIPLMRYAYRSMPYIDCQLEPTNTIVCANNIY